jgi:hypothetical protein
MNVFLHVIILFTILSALFKFVITKLSSDLFTHEINRLMHDTISVNTNKMLENPEINKILYNLLDSKLNTFMKELNDIQKILIVTNENITKLTNINTNLNSMQMVLINANLMKSPNNKDNDDSALDKIANFNNRLIDAIKLLQRIQSTIRENPSRLNLVNIIQVLNHTDVFQQVSASLNKPDPTAKIINDNLFDKMSTFIIFLVVFFIILAFIFSKNSDFHISHILIENGITFTFIGIIEVIFFLMIAYKYLPVVPSFLNTKLFDTLKQKFSN